MPPAPVGPFDLGGGGFLPGFVAVCTLSCSCVCRRFLGRVCALYVTEVAEERMGGGGVGAPPVFDERVGRGGTFALGCAEVGMGAVGRGGGDEQGSSSYGPSGRLS